MKSKTLLSALVFFFLFQVAVFAASIIPYSNLGIVAEKSTSIVLAKATSNYEAQVGENTFFRTDFEVLSSIKGDLPPAKQLFHSGCKLFKKWSLYGTFWRCKISSWRRVFIIFK